MTCYRDFVVLTEWEDIAGLIVGIYAGMVAMVFLVIYLEDRLANPGERRKLWRRR